MRRYPKCGLAQFPSRRRGDKCRCRKALRTLCTQTYPREKKRSESGAWCRESVMEITPAHTKYLLAQSEHLVKAIVACLRDALTCIPLEASHP